MGSARPWSGPPWQHLVAMGEDVVLVRGHLAYYPRFGFSVAAAQAFRTPYDGPNMHALALTRAGGRPPGGVSYPPAFAALL